MNAIIETTQEERSEYVQMGAKRRSPMKNTRVVDSLDRQLQQLVAEACSYPAKSVKRRQKLSAIVRVVTKSGKLWREDTPYYKDALQQSWLYFCRNPEQYKPDSCGVITWLNNCLKWRLQDLRSSLLEEQAKTTEGKVDLVERLPASPDIPPILEETYEWVHTDPDGELCNTHVKGRHDVTCQILILRRLPPETTWEAIAKEFKLPFATAPNFYKRECLPRLRKFALKQGYLI